MGEGRGGKTSRSCPAIRFLRDAVKLQSLYAWRGSVLPSMPTGTRRAEMLCGIPQPVSGQGADNRGMATGGRLPVRAEIGARFRLRSLVR